MMPSTRPETRNAKPFRPRFVKPLPLNYVGYFLRLRQKYLTCIFKKMISLLNTGSYDHQYIGKDNHGKAPRVPALYLRLVTKIAGAICTADDGNGGKGEPSVTPRGVPAIWRLPYPG